MCGIAGYLHFNDQRIAQSHILSRMTDCIAHRGPDGFGYYLKNNLAFGHRRLSIIDLQTGNQPMFSDNKMITLIFNGEIYNYLELREELRSFGYQFKTDSDTEVIIKAYEKWGIDCQKKFNGMWAFALWDQEKNELFLSRDRIGEKPLFYTTIDDSVVFASELKSIIQYGVPLEKNLEVLELYLFLTYIPTPYTFYKNVFKLRPGHYLRIKDGRVSENQYWDLPEVHEERLLTDKKAVAEKFEEIFRDAVRLRMRSDVAFGAFLSGGLDSSSVVAAMASFSKKKIETFTIGFEDKAFDESALAAEVSSRFKTNHHLGTVKPDSFEDALRMVVQHFGEPFGDSSAIPTAHVSKYASTQVKMVLTGDGGDEILSGYNSYLGLQITERYNRLPKFIQTSIPLIAKSLSRLTSNKLRYRLNKIESVSRTALMSFNSRMVHKMAYTDYAKIKELTNGIAVITIEDFIEDFYSRYKLKDDFYKLMFFDFKHNLPDDYLPKVDRMSMAHSLEARVPFLDYRLIEYMSQVHKKIKLEKWTTKSVLRNSMGPLLPENILRAPKRGFGIPLREWFKDKSFSQHLEKLIHIPHLNSLTVKEIIDDNRTGKKDNGNFIWCLFVLNEFLQEKNDTYKISQ